MRQDALFARATPTDPGCAVVVDTEGATCIPCSRLAYMTKLKLIGDVARIPPQDVASMTHNDECLSYEQIMGRLAASRITEHDGDDVL